MTQPARRALDKARAEAATRELYLLRTLFPTEGPLRRELYPKHLKFFAAGGVRAADGTYVHDQRAFVAGNRVGKTVAGGFETSLHLTGLYDEYAPWWVGRRFETPIGAWVAGDTSKTTRDILQRALFGPITAFGSGLIPRHLIVDKNAKSSVPDAIDSAWIKHIDGGVSMLTFKSYLEGRTAFQGTSQHLIWLDEECPEDVYDECKLRTMIVDGTPFGGQMMLTFTPLMGLTPVVLRYMPGGTMTEGEVLEVAA